MSFVVATDTSSNLQSKVVAENELVVVPFSYYVEGVEHTCLDSSAFSGDEYYDMIRRGTQVTTSQVTPQRYISVFEPLLRDGKDILFVSMSSGISGSCASAEMAARELREQFPDRKIKIIDTLSASLGEGLVAVRAAQCRAAGMSFEETAKLLLAQSRRMCQIFTVDDLMHLRRGGRLSNLSAIVGTVLHIKPLLKGDGAGQIVCFAKIRGRKRAIEGLAERYDRLAVAPEGQTVGIAHAGCREDAEYLAGLLRRNRPPREIMSVEYEPVTGSHVGPGALALFFESTDEVRSVLS